MPDTWKDTDECLEQIIEWAKGAQNYSAMGNIGSALRCLEQTEKWLSSARESLLRRPKRPRKGTMSHV
jgi:hypothetical protein